MKRGSETVVAKVLDLAPIYTPPGVTVEIGWTSSIEHDHVGAATPVSGTRVVTTEPPKQALRRKR